MASSQLRLSGLNTGLDTESIIQQMLYTYQSKIDQQNQKLQKLQWQQEMYRDIITKMNTFKGKYFDILKRDSYLMTPTNFSKFSTNITTKSGKDSGLKVTASSSAAEGTHKIKVDQLATAAVTKGSQVASANFKLDVDNAMKTAEVDEDGNYNFSLDVKVGNVAKTIEFSGANKDELLESLNSELVSAFGKTSGGDAFLSASLNENGEFAFKTSGNATATVTERVGNFGMTALSKKVAVNPGAALTGTSSISVTIPNYYTGEMITKNVEFSTVSNTYFDARTTDANIKAVYESLKKAAFAEQYGMNVNSVTDAMMNEANFSYTSADAAYDLNRESMLNALNGAFYMEQGISFGMSGSSMVAQYIQDGSYAEFSMTSTCDSTLGIQKGSSTSYIDEKAKLADLGFEMNITETTTETRVVKDENGKLVVDDEGNVVTEEVEVVTGLGYSLTINGKEITVGKDATVADLIEAVNKSGAGVTMSYNKLEGAFTITANDKGTGGNIDISDDDAFAKSLGLTSGAGARYTEGTNAMITVDGVTVEHNDNVYELDGITFDFSEVDPTQGEEITVTLGKDYSDIKQSIKDFVNDYNQMIDDITKYTKTARPTDSKTKSYYEPLTDEAKEEMSEKEIEKWEELAKQGLLYNDSTVNSVLSQLRTTLYSTIELEDGSKFSLVNMGIKVASFFDDAEGSKLGKLTLDEAALDKAFETNAEAIEKLFTDPNNGVMAKVNKVLDNAVKDTVASKGSLVRKAGTSSSSSSKDNLIYREMERIKDRIATLQKRYDKKEEYWWKIFTNLETMQTQFTQQQSYLEQFVANGGYFSG